MFSFIFQPSFLLSLLQLTDILFGELPRVRLDRCCRRNYKQMWDGPPTLDEEPEESDGAVSADRIAINTTIGTLGQFDFCFVFIFIKKFIMIITVRRVIHQKQVVLKFEAIVVLLTAKRRKRHTVVKKYIVRKKCSKQFFNGNQTNVLSVSFL